MSLKYHCKANHRIIFFHISAGVISYGEKLDFVFVVLRDFVVFLSKVFEAKKVEFHVFRLCSEASNKKVTHLHTGKTQCLLTSKDIIVFINYLKNMPDYPLETL